MVEKKCIIHENQTLLEALRQINDLREGPLVLFVVDDKERMVGTLTDGDARRALIAGANLNDKTSMVMHTNFKFIREGVGDIVVQLQKQRGLNMTLVPVLDMNNKISDIINLEKYITRVSIQPLFRRSQK